MAAARVGREVSSVVDDQVGGDERRQRLFKQSVHVSVRVENQYRFADECARHKALDLIGDLYLVGRPIRGRLVAHKSGHELNHMLARKLIAHRARIPAETLADPAADLKPFSIPQPRG